MTNGLHQQNISLHHEAYSVVVQFGDQQQHSFKLYSYYKKAREAMSSRRPW